MQEIRKEVILISLWLDLDSLKMFSCFFTVENIGTIKISFSTQFINLLH